MLSQYAERSLEVRPVSLSSIYDSDHYVSLKFQGILQGSVSQVRGDSSAAGQDLSCATSSVTCSKAKAQFSYAGTHGGYGALLWRERLPTFRILRAVKKPFWFDKWDWNLWDTIRCQFLILIVFLEERLDGALVRPSLWYGRATNASSGLSYATMFGSKHDDRCDFNRWSEYGCLEKRAGLLLQNQDAYRLVRCQVSLRWLVCDLQKGWQQPPEWYWLLELNSCKSACC